MKPFISCTDISLPGPHLQQNFAKKRGTGVMIECRLWRLDSLGSKPSCVAMGKSLNLQGRLINGPSPKAPVP